MERQLADFAHADTFLLQDVRNWRQHPLRDTLPDGLRVVRFPFIYIAALWPFDSFIAGDDTAMSREMAALGQASANPIPFGFQDAVLDRLRAEVADPEERLRRYRALEFENPPDLIRYAELEAARLSYQVPLHPEVIRSLGLTWVTPDSRYAQLNGATLTFDEYYGRYARYPMQEAMA